MSREDFDCPGCGAVAIWLAMDFITHPLVGAGLARVITPRRELLPQTTLAGILASLVMDNDSWLFLLGPDAYGRYHRVFTHCLPGLIFWTFFSAALVQAVACVKKWRCFGWFLTPNLPQSEIPPRASWRLLIAVSAGAVAFHWLLDIPSDFGNLELLYPWSDKEFSLGIVASFDWVIFGATLVWYLASREFVWRRKRELFLFLGWFALVFGYLAIRYRMGHHAVWPFRA